MALIISVCLAVPEAGMAQFADEVWIEPPFWVSGFGSGQRVDFLNVVKDPGLWPTVHRRTSTFATFVNTLAINLPGQALDDSEIQTLLAGLGTLRVDFNVGGLRKPAGSVGAIQCDLMGDDTATADFAKLRRWVENGGTIYSLTTDHAISAFSMGPFARPAGDPEKLECLQTGGVGTYPSSTTDLDFWVSELSDYFAKIQNRFYARCSGSDGEGAGDSRFCMDLRIGTWEGASSFQETTPDGTVYPVRGFIPPIEMSTVLTSLATELATRQVTNPGTGDSATLRQRWNHFNIDHRPEAVCVDLVGNSEAACTTGPDLQENQLDYCASGNNNFMCLDWDFGRVLEIERLARAEGLRVGNSNFLSSFNNVGDPNYGDAFARDVAMRYVTEYADAGGNPDFLQIFMWVTHPDETGNENNVNSFMNVARQILEGPFPEVVEVPYVTEPFDPADWSWSFSSSASIQSVTCGASTCFYLDTPADASGFEWALLDDESFGAARIGVSLDLSKTTGSGSEWAALQLRPQGTPTPAPWASDGGLAILVRNDSAGFADNVSVLRNGTTLETADLAGLGLPNLDGWFRLEVDVRGNRLRVEVKAGQETRKVIDLRVDEARAGGTLARGPVRLVASQADVAWDSFKIDQFRLRDLLLEDDFADGTDPADWLPSSSFTATNGEIQSSVSGTSQMTAAVGQVDDLRAFTKLQLTGAGGWAGIHLRKKGPTSPPWSGTEGGFLVHLQTDGTLSGYNKAVGGSGDLFPPVATGLDPVAGVINLGVELVDNRIRVFVAQEPADPEPGVEPAELFSGSPAAEAYFACPTCGDAGEVGLITLNQAATFDDVVIEALE